MFEISLDFVFSCSYKENHGRARKFHHYFLPHSRVDQIDRYKQLKAKIEN